MFLFLYDQFPECDPLKMLSLAFLHDLGELDYGDHPAVLNISNKRKYNEESSTINRLSEILSSGKCNLLMSMHEEYLSGSSPEAKVLKNVDKTN